MTDLSPEETQKMQYFLDELLAKRGCSDKEGEEFLQILEEKAKLLLSKEPFYPGDVVKWKKGLRNKKYPEEVQPAYVIQELVKPMTRTEKIPGSPYFQEPLDLELAILDQDGDLVTFYYDSRRFKLEKGGYEREKLQR